MRAPLPAALLLTAAILLTATPAAAQGGGEAGFRDAPTLAAKTWVQGEATQLQDKDRIYVIELWATWCGPCRTSLPALAELQTEHADALTTVALTNDDLGAVRRYVKATPAMKPLRVAVDAGAYERFSKAFGVSAIPTAFLVRDGEVLWQGHPAGMELILERVLEGRWTPRSEAKMRAFVKQANAAESSWKKSGTMTAGARKQARGLLKEAEDNPMAANGLAWAWLTNGKPGKRPLKLALEMARAANDGTGGENHAILDTYARALYLNGKRKKATALQSKALTLCQKAPRANCGDLKQVLEVYQAGGTLP